jgi:hypothetical protein
VNFYSLVRAWPLNRVSGNQPLAARRREFRKMLEAPNHDRCARNKCTARTGVVAFAAIVGLAACATASPYPYNPERLADGQAGRIGQVCQSVIGVQPPEARYFACIGSLSDSARNLGRGRALQQAREDCEARGLRPGSAGLAVCVVQSAGDGRTSAPEISTDSSMPAPGLAKTYPYASQRDVHRREELSCARLGLDPAGGAFANCVGGLDSALFEADNPSQ